MLENKTKELRSTTEIFVEEIDTSKLVRNKKPIKMAGKNGGNLKRDTNLSVTAAKVQTGTTVPIKRAETRRVVDDITKIEIDARRNKAASECLDELRPTVTGQKLVARTIKATKRSVS
jgi:hypothetical protein